MHRRLISAVLLLLIVLSGCAPAATQGASAAPVSIPAPQPEPPAPVPEPAAEPMSASVPARTLTAEETIWLSGTQVTLYTDGQRQYLSADALECLPLCPPQALMLCGLRWYALDDVTSTAPFVWGTAPDGLRYLARKVDAALPEADICVPVLMYHATGDELWGYSDLFVSAASLEQQLLYLQENGYSPIWFSDLAHVEEYEKPVILTFDDGYDDNYTVLFPLLQKYQMKATIFVIGNAMGQPHKMTREQVTELAASGLVSIQSHTYTHGNLSAMDEQTLRQEMALCNDALAAATGQLPYVLCYPEGKYSHLTMDVARQYYSFALRMDGGTYHTGGDPYQVPRSYISRRTTLSDYQWYLLPSGQFA